MKKSVIFVAIISLILFVGCWGGNDEPVVNHHIDIKTMPSNEIKDVSPNSEIVVDNIDLKEGYFLSTATKGSGNNGKENGNSNVYKTMGGDYLAVPNADRQISLHGSDIGIYNKTSAFIKKYENIDDDLKITHGESPENQNLVIGLTDEFYYVDFAERQDLNPSKVALVYSQEGVIGDFKLIQYGMTTKHNYSVFNLSDFPGFGLYSYVSKNWTDTDRDWNVMLHATSPVSIQTNPTVKRSVNDGAAVIDVDLPTGKYYTIEATYSTEEELKCLIYDVNARYYDGEARDEIMIPVVKDSKVIYYTGLVDRPFVFTINLSTNDSSKVDDIPFTYKVSEASSFPGFFDLAQLKNGDHKIHSSSESRYLTFAYRMTEGGVYPFTPGTTQSGNNIYDMISISRGKHSHGSGTGFSGTIDTDTTKTGYIIWDCNNLADDTLLGTWSWKEKEYITCSHIKWNPTSMRYECQDDGCGKSYEYNDMFKYGWDSSLDRDLQVDLGKLGIAYVTNCGGLAFKDVSDASFNTGGNAEGEQGEFASLSHGDDIEDNVYVALKEAWFDSDHMVSKAIFTIKVHFKKWGTSDPEVYNNITANYVHLHEWDFSDSSIAVCSCGEERPYTSGWIEPGYNNAVIAGLKAQDKIYVVDITGDYSVELPNGSYSFPILPSRTVIYFVSPKTGCKLTLSGQGNDYKIKASY